MTTFLFVNGEKFLRSLLPKKFSASALSYEETRPCLVGLWFLPSPPSPWAHPLLTLTYPLPSAYLIVLEAMCGLMEETDANCRHRSNMEALASRALQRREVREGPSEYLFDRGTNGTAIYMYRVIIPRPVTLAASTRPPFFPGSI
jgi:hypothetical protein